MLKDHIRATMAQLSQFLMAFQFSVYGRIGNVLLTNEAKNLCLKGGSTVMSRKTSCVKASREAAVLIHSLKEGSYLLKIVNSGLDVLKGNMFAGERIERGEISEVLHSEVWSE